MKLHIIFMAVLVLVSACEIMPRNSLKDCKAQCKDSNKTKACNEFCECIHLQGRSLDECLDKYNQAPEDSVGTK